MYHHVNPNAGDLVTTIPEVFERHLQHWEGREVLFTLDDGFLDNWIYAFPLLKKYNQKAILFIVTSWIGDGPARQTGDFPRHLEVINRIRTGNKSVTLNWAELKEMQQSGLVDIQCHTHKHYDYFVNDLLELDEGTEKTLQDDLAQCKEILERGLNKKCESLAWPWGKYSPRAITLAERVGFKRTYGTDLRGWQSLNDRSPILRTPAPRR